jgi:hypothetical protein
MTMPGISSLRFNLRLGLVALIFVLLLLPPVLNALPAGHPLRVSDFVVAVMRASLAWGTAPSSLWAAMPWACI